MFNTNAQIYSASALLVPAAAATDVFVLSPGIPNNKLTILAVALSGFATAAAAANVQFIKRSTLDTGGTSSAVVPALLDIGPPSASGFNLPKSNAIALAYTVNPGALGAVAAPYGTILNTYLTLGTATAPQPQFQSPVSFAAPLVCVLRQITEQFCINLVGGTFAGNSVACSVFFAEEQAST